MKSSRGVESEGWARDGPGHMAGFAIPISLRALHCQKNMFEYVVISGVNKLQFDLTLVLPFFVWECLSCIELLEFNAVFRNVVSRHLCVRFFVCGILQLHM